MVNRLSVAVVKMTGCSGCQMEMLRLEEDFSALLELIDFKYFVMARSDNSNVPYDLAFVEGSVSTSRELKELRELRSRSKTLVALGDCACSGGIPSILNWIPHDISAKVYEDFQSIHSKKESFQSIHALDEYVPINIHLRGCPPHKNQILEVIRSALIGAEPRLRRHPVCVECKLKGNVCILTSERRPCMGPVTMAGCGAICPSVNRECEGCYGPMSDANAASLAKEFLDIGLSKDDVLRRFRKYAGTTTAFVEEANPQ